MALVCQVIRPVCASLASTRFAKAMPVFMPSQRKGSGSHERDLCPTQGRRGTVTGAQDTTLSDLHPSGDGWAGSMLWITPLVKMVDSAVI